MHSLPAKPAPDLDRPGGASGSSAPAGPALMPSLAAINFAVVSLSLGFLIVLLPNQLTLLDADNKVGNLALVTSVSLAVSVIVQPLVGALSDRTRSRWGRRTPWMIVGGTIMALSVSGLGFLQSVGLIVAFACLLQIGSAVLGAPLAAIIADRYPENKRGMVSAFIGLGLNVGYAVGVLLAAQLAADLALAYLTLAGGFTIVLVAFLVVSRDAPNRSEPIPPFRFSRFLTSFWINPILHRDFGWAFLARFLYILAFFVTQTYLFFILTDYIKLDLDGANTTIGVLGIISMFPAIIAGYLTGWLSDRFGRRKVLLYIACVFTAVGYLALILLPDMAGIYAMTILTNIGFGMYLSSDAVVMTQVLPDIEGAAAKDLGILNLATIVGQSLSAIVAAFAITSLGGYVGLLVVGIAISVLGALAVIPIRGVR